MININCGHKTAWLSLYDSFFLGGTWLEKLQKTVHFNCSRVWRERRVRWYWVYLGQILVVVPLLLLITDHCWSLEYTGHWSGEVSQDHDERQPGLMRTKTSPNIETDETWDYDDIQHTNTTDKSMKNNWDNSDLPRINKEWEGKTQCYALKASACMMLSLFSSCGVEYLRNFYNVWSAQHQLSIIKSVIVKKNSQIWIFSGKCIAGLCFVETFEIEF